MIHRHLLLEPSTPASEAGGAAVAPAAPPKPQNSGLPKPVTSRAPTESEKKVEFKLEPIPGDPNFLDSFKVQQLKTTGEQPDRPQAPKLEVPKSDVVAPAAPKVEEKKVETPEEKKIEAVPAEKKEEKKATDDGPILPPSAKTDVTGTKHFDYSGYTEQEVVVLKNMSSQSREVVSKMMKENKELSKLRNADYLQNPNAYLLSPEYQQMQSEYTFATQEAMHWQDQLVKIEKGENWTPIIGVDEKTGKFVYGEPRVPTTQDKIQVTRAMNNCFSASERVQQAAFQLQQTYSERIKQDNARIHEVQAAQFGWVSKPELMESKLTIASGAEKTLKQIKDDFLSMVPVYRRNTVEADVAANLWIALQIYGSELRELRAAKTVAEIKTEEVRRAEPTSQSRPSTGGSGKPVNGVTSFTLEGMPR